MKKIKAVLFMSILPLLVALFAAIGDVSLAACRGFLFELEVPEELK